MSTPAHALPEVGTVVEGDATINYDEESLVINQGSQNIIIEWDSFDVAADESVHFDQTELMAALNRVLNGEPSAILGSVSGAGSITLVNPAGISFGPEADIDVGAITATTVDILNERFMAGDMTFDQYDDAYADASVTNEGTITVDNQGLAALVAPGVENNGVIQARTGSVALASGTAFTVDFYGDGLVNFAVTGETEAQPVGADGEPLPALVGNSGEVYADGGTVIMTAEAVEGVVDDAINMDGVVQARSIEGRDGQIALVAGEGAGAVQVAGTVDASGAEAGTTGGTVHALGDEVALEDGADVNVSGPAGGGEALVGGAVGGGANAPDAAIQYEDTGDATVIIADSGYDAGGYMPTSDVVDFAADAAIAADATDAGDGGTAVVWAEKEAYFHGAISARGGPDGGDGGFVETSSAGRVHVDGTVIASARAGTGGDWLIDPTNVCVAAAAATCFADESFVDTASIVASVNTAGPGASVDVTTPAAGSDDGDIRVFDDILTATTSDDVSLRFLAADDFSMSGPEIADSGQGLNVEIETGVGGDPALEPHDIFLQGDILTNGGAFTARTDLFSLNATIDTTADPTPSLDDGRVNIVSDVYDITPGGATIDAGGSRVTLDRRTPGLFSLGVDNGGTNLSQAELETINAEFLAIGDPSGGFDVPMHTNQLEEIVVEDVDATTGTIAEDVELYAEGDPFGGIRIVDENRFNGLRALATDDVSFEVNDGPGQTTVNGNAFLFADSDGTTTAASENISLSGGHTLSATGDLFMILGPHNDGSQLDGGSLDTSFRMAIDLSQPGRLGIGDSVVLTDPDSGDVVDVTLSQAELDAMSSPSTSIGIIFGFENAADTIFQNADLTGLGTVLARARNEVNDLPDMFFAGDGNTFESLLAGAKDDVRVLGPVATTGGDMSLSAGHAVSSSHSDLRIEDALSTTGGDFSGFADDDLRFEAGGFGDGSLTTDGGDVTLETLGVGALSAFTMDASTSIDTTVAPGTEGNVTVVADFVDLDTTGGTRIDAADGGSLGDGAIAFHRVTDGAIGLGTGAGGVQLSQDELDTLEAQTLAFGAQSADDSHTTEINSVTVDLSAFAFVEMTAFDGTSINYSGPNVFANLTAVDSSDINVNPGATVKADTIHFDAPTVNLSGDLVAAGGPGGDITGTATTVNVLSPGAEIQDGVDVAAATTPPTPLITVGPGTYAESVEVYKTVRLWGEQTGADPVTRGGPETVVAPPSSGFLVTADGVAVDGFEIVGGTTGVLVDGADNVSVTHTIVHGQTGPDGPELGDGIYVTDSVGATVADNYVFNIADDGIQGDDAAGALVEHNTLDEIGLAGIAFIRGSDDPTIEHNEMTDVGGFGIRASGGGTVTVAHNTLTGVASTPHPFTNDGIHVDSRDGTFTGGSVAHNQVIGAAGAGIEIEDLDTGLAVDQNEIDDVEIGIFVNDSDGTQVTANTITNANVGVLVDPSFGADVIGNEISLTGIGINYIGSGDAVVEDNTVFDVDTGIRVVELDGTLGLDGNSVDARDRAIDLLELLDPNVLTVSGGSYTGGTNALFARNVETGVGDSGLLVVENNPTFATGDIAVHLLTGTAPGIALDLTAASAGIEGGANGLRLQGEGVTLTGDTLGGIAFDGQSDQYVELLDGAEFQPGEPTFIDPTGVDFDGLSFADPGDLAVLESRVTHFYDTGDVGLLYYGPTIGVADGDSIQRAVNIAADVRFAAGDTSAVEEIAVGSGSYGGNVELWVDDLKITGVDTGGGAPVIDLSTGGALGNGLDPFSNNPTLPRHGFLVGDFGPPGGAVGDGASGDVGGTFGSHGNGLDITGVEIDPLTITGDGAPSPTYGVFVGLVDEPTSGPSVATDITIDGNAFFDLDYGVLADNVGGTTTISGNVMRRISEHGVFVTASQIAGDSVAVTDNAIGAGDNGIYFIGDTVDADIDIHDNIIQANRNNTTFGAGIFFDGAVTDSNVAIGDGSGAAGGESNVVSVLSDGTVDLLDAIHFAGPVDGTTRVEIDGNRLGYTPAPLTVLPLADDGIEFHDAVTGEAEVVVTDNWIDAADDGVQFNADVGSAPNILIGGDLTGPDGNQIHAGDDGVSFLGDLTGEAIVEISHNDIEVGDDGIYFQGHVDNAQAAPVSERELDIHHNAIDGADNGIFFAGGISGFRHDTRIAHNDVEGDGRNAVRVEGGIDDAEVRIVSNDLLRGAEDGIDVIGGLSNAALVRIAGNADIEGVGDDAIHFEDAVETSTVEVLGNFMIVGEDDGIDFDKPVEDGASFEIAWNKLIIGEKDSGIEFSGVLDHDTDAEIAWNRLILGGDNGIRLGRADLRGGRGPIERWLSGHLGEGWAIDGASVEIVHNRTIEGRDDDGILAEGVRGAHWNHDRNLLVGWNHEIEGMDNGIHLSHGVDFDLDTRFDFAGPVVTVDLDKWAIDRARVAILGNHEIEGEHDDGIRVDGLRDGDFGSFFHLGFGTDVTELEIVGNHKILGEDNGIAIERGLTLDLLAKLGFARDLTALGASVATAVADGPSGLATPLGGVELQGLIVGATHAAISGAEAEIADNDVIAGKGDNGILVRGIFDGADRPSGDGETETDVALLAPSGTDWSLDVHDNVAIVGPDHGVHIDHGHRLFATLFEPRRVTDLATESLGLAGDLTLFARFDAWGIAGGNARLADNWLIAGLDNGIRVDGVRGGGVEAEPAFLDEDAPGGPAVVPVATDPSQPNLLIADNVSIIGGRDGIHLGTGFGTHLFLPGTPERRALTAEAFGPGTGFGDGLGHGGESIHGGLVVIDRNGRADYALDPDAGGPAEVGDGYDPDIPVILSDLDFGDGPPWTGEIFGRLIGVFGDGIDVSGATRYGATLQIQRNMLTGSGDNGIELAQIGGPVLPDELGGPDAGSASLGLLYGGPGHEEDYGPTNVFIHNNFIVDNGQRVEPEEDAAATESLAGFPGGHTLTGAGILFEQSVGSNAEAEVFQNYVAANGGPGIQVGFDETGLPTFALVPPSLVSADGLSVIHNYIPGPVDEFDDQPNGRFAIANYADVGEVFAEENWWGTTDAGDVAASILGPVDFLPYLASGVDSNVERAPGLTGLAPFAFQPGAPFITPVAPPTGLVDFLAEALFTFEATQTDPSQAPGDELGPEPRSDRDAENVFDSVYADQYSYMEGANLAELTPAAQGASGCAMVEIPDGVQLNCDGGALSDLEPSAGPSQPSGFAGVDPGIAVRDLVNMWLFNFDLPLETEPAGTQPLAGQQQAAREADASMLASRI